MKKLIALLAMVVLAAQSNAAQINWGLTGQIKFENALVGTSGATLQLVCLDGITTDWSVYAKTVANGDTANVVKTKTTNAGSMAPANATSSPYAFTWAEDGSPTSISTATIADGTLFAMLATTIQDGKSYYWASDVFEVSESSANYTATSRTYSMNVTVANAMGTNGDKWTAVPEPSTAALALAGLALLLKRRKA